MRLAGFHAPASGSLHTHARTRARRWRLDLLSEVLTCELTAFFGGASPARAGREIEFVGVVGAFVLQLESFSALEARSRLSLPDLAAVSTAAALTAKLVRRSSRGVQLSVGVRVRV